MQDLIKQVNGLPLIVKLLLCIPFVEIFYGICRVINQLTKGSINILYLIVAILTIIPGGCRFITSIPDLYQFYTNFCRSINEINPFPIFCRFVVAIVVQP